MASRNKNIKLLLNYGVGPILFGWLCWSIYQQVTHQPHLDSTLRTMRTTISGSQSWKLYAALLMVIVNWGIEARKWQVLLRPLEQVSFLKAFKATLAGVAFAINTPNRIGEYAGRVLYVQDGHRWQAVSITIVGSFSQLMVTLLMGTAGLVFLLKDASMSVAIAPYYIWVRVMFYGTLLITAVMLVLYFRLSWLVKWIEKVPQTNRFLRHIAVIQELPVTILLRVASLSAFRYIVFVIQYILLLQLLAVDISVWQAFWLVTVLYLVLAIIPTIALAEIGVRGQVSLFIFNMVSTNGLGIVAASFSIWFMNLVIPSLAGSLLFLGIKIFSDK